MVPVPVVYPECMGKPVVYPFWRHPSLKATVNQTSCRSPRRNDPQPLQADMLGRSRQGKTTGGRFDGFSCERVTMQFGALKGLSQFQVGHTGSEMRSFQGSKVDTHPTERHSAFSGS